MENLFLSEYFSQLKEYNSIPKLQIERAISPLLGIFIQELVSFLLKDNANLSGEMEMILPEFPLKKENNQSTNIDWLVLNKTKNILLFIELKTAGSSFNSSQLQIYTEIQKLIKRFTAKFLIDELETIRNHSVEKKKYDFILGKINKYRNIFSEIKDTEIVYIVPSSVKGKVKDNPVFSFQDFPEILDHKFVNEWKLLREFFTYIDDQPDTNIEYHIDKTDRFNSDLLNKLTLIKKTYNKTPQHIWFGNTGDGRNPNFQIQFTDGTVKPFYNSGKEYIRAERFDNSKLDGPYEIKSL